MEVLGEKKSGEWVQKAEKDKTEIATGLGGTREIEKWDETGSPEIADRGETSEMPPPPHGLPSLGLTRVWPSLRPCLSERVSPSAAGHCQAEAASYMIKGQFAPTRSQPSAVGKRNH